MSTLETLVVLGDEHVGPMLSVWSATPAEVATRLVPQTCETLDDAMAWAKVRLGDAVPANARPWVRRGDGRVLSPAYLRACARYYPA